MSRMRDAMEMLLRGEIPPPPVARRLGLALTACAPGEAVVELPVDEGHTNPMGTVQGGILAAIADAAMGWAYMTLLEEGETYTTLEMKINFLKPVWQGRLSARARVRKTGRTVGLVECDILDEAGKSAAYAVSTCMRLWP
jgi:uncharacterized protein (TIGR00369 family)